MGIETAQKKMKKKISKLSKGEREKVEAAYHRMKPADFEETMAASIHRSPNAIRLPDRLAKRLRTVAKLGGEDEYQTMVRTWIEERLQREAKTLR
jgi:hypothetical protein